MMDELGLPADEKAAMDAMMAAAQAGETPSDEMIQKAQRAGEHMNALAAGADSAESSSTPMPEAPSGPTDADVVAVDTMMDELGLPADEKAAMDAMMAAAQAGETPSDEMIQKAQGAGEHMNKLLAAAGAD